MSIKMYLTIHCFLFCFLGLTCTEQNFITKAGSQQAASEHGIIIVAPDTSPRKHLNIYSLQSCWSISRGIKPYIWLLLIPIILEMHRPK